MVKSILILEDEPEIIENLKFDLKDFAESLFFSSNGKEALILLKEKEVDCIISDIHMDEMDGVTFIKKARELGIEKPVIFLTGQNGLYLIDKFSGPDVSIETLGETEFLFKPYQVEDLKNAITKLTNSKNP